MRPRLVDTTTDERGRYYPWVRASNEGTIGRNLTGERVASQIMNHSTGPALALREIAQNRRTEGEDSDPPPFGTKKM